MLWGAWVERLYVSLGQPLLCALLARRVDEGTAPSIFLDESVSLCLPNCFSGKVARVCIRRTECTDLKMKEGRGGAGWRVCVCAGERVITKGFVVLRLQMFEYGVP